MIASTCNSGYYLVNTDCVLCGTGATACTSTTVHTTCASDYSLISGSTICQACTAIGAASCTTALATATSCKTGYFGTTTCTACGSN
jgi:hypothetical protein